MENTHGRWFGSLELRFETAGTQTILKRSRHVGPLRVQRPFKEPDGGCQVYVLNPPGGTVGGDELRVYGHLGAGSRVLLTAPGAAKFYRSAGPLAFTKQDFAVEPGARLEWLPQETIVYDGAVAEACTHVDLEPGASFAGWEITCLGRPACGERFESGRFAQRFELWSGGRPLWLERNVFTGGDEALDAVWGLQGKPVFGTMILHPVSDAALDAAREALGEPALGTCAAATVLEHVTGEQTLVCRSLGDSTSRARAAFTRVWQRLRPSELGSEAHSPRIWAT
jgi:urease accessory protein